MLTNNNSGEMISNKHGCPSRDQTLREMQNYRGIICLAFLELDAVVALKAIRYIEIQRTTRGDCARRPTMRQPETRLYLAK